MMMKSSYPVMWPRWSKRSLWAKCGGSGSAFAMISWRRARADGKGSAEAVSHEERHGGISWLTAWLTSSPGFESIARKGWHRIVLDEDVCRRSSWPKWYTCRQIIKGRGWKAATDSIRMPKALKPLCLISLIHHWSCMISLFSFYLLPSKVIIVGSLTKRWELFRFGNNSGWKQFENGPGWRQLKPFLFFHPLLNFTSLAPNLMEIPSDCGVQRFTWRYALGLMQFVTAAARLFCLALPG